MPAGKRSPLAIRIAVAVVLGAAVGRLFGGHVSFLGEVAVAIIQVLKALAAPLVFFAVAEACSRIDIGWKQARRLITISLTNACVAGAIALTLDRFVPVGGSAALRAGLSTGKAPETVPPRLSFGDVLSGIVPKSVIQPFSDNQVLGAVVLAVMAGLALRTLKGRADDRTRSQIALVDDFFSGVLRLLTVALGWIVEIVPVAVFCVMAKVVGQSGFDSFVSLGVLMAIIVAGFLLQAGVYYAALLRAFARVSPVTFFRQASEALMTALATGSSLATLPVTIRVLQERMKVRPQNARLAAMVGTNLNHDGILLYEAATALFLARVLGIHFGPGQQVAVIAVSALAAFGIGGIPDAGLITLSLVLSAVKLPLAAVPLLLPIDWLIGRMRATLNVTSDMVVAHLLDAWDRSPAVEIGPSPGAESEPSA